MFLKNIFAIVQLSLYCHSLSLLSQRKKCPRSSTTNHPLHWISHCPFPFYLCSVLQSLLHILNNTSSVNLTTPNCSSLKYMKIYILLHWTRVSMTSSPVILAASVVMGQRLEAGIIWRVTHSHAGRVVWAALQEFR